MVAKYGANSNWDLKEVQHQEGHGDGMWKAILKGREEIWRFLSFNMGSKDNIQFWKDHWCGKNLLKVEFRIIHLLTRNKQSSAASNLDFNGEGVWAAILRKNIND